MNFRSPIKMSDELARRGGLLQPYAVAFSLSLHTFTIHSFFLLECFIKIFDTQVFLSSLCFLVMHACCVFLHPRCNEHSLFLSFQAFKIGRIENYFCSAYGPRLLPKSCCRASGSYKQQALCPLFALFRTYNPGRGELTGFWVY